jgi:hypothetical protein
VTQGTGAIFKFEDVGLRPGGLKGCAIRRSHGIAVLNVSSLVLKLQCPPTMCATAEPGRFQCGTARPGEVSRRKKHRIFLENFSRKIRRKWRKILFRYRASARHLALAEWRVAARGELEGFIFTIDCTLPASDRHLALAGCRVAAHKELTGFIFTIDCTLLVRPSAQHLALAG